MTPTHAPSQERRTLAWLFLRLAVATLILLGAAGLKSRYDFTRQAIFLVSVVLFGSSTLGLIGLMRKARRSFEALLLIDLAVTTGLLWLTGSAASPFSFLYGLLTLAGAMVLGPSTALWVGGTAVVFFLALSWSVVAGVLPPPPDQIDGSYALTATELATFTLSNVIGIGTVSLLATNLALRVQSAGGQLAQAERAVAGLTRRNVDIVRSISSGLLTTNLSGIIESANPAAAAMFRAEVAELVGQPLERVIAVSEVSDERTEAEARRPDGTSFPAGFRTSPLADADGNVTGSVMTFQDLTEVNRLRHEAAEAQRMAHLGRLAAGLAHEIRNPLTGISGSVELVRDGGGLSRDDERLLGIVLRETDRLNTLVATMLRVARPSLPSPSDVDLRRLVSEVIEMASVEAEEQGLRIELEDNGVDDLTLRADGDQLRQVVWNLLRNAQQASSAGHVVLVRLGREDEQVWLSVQDEGEGLSEDAKAHLFEMFYSGRSHGIGLGLTLVQQIVHEHGGSISAHNVEPTGACFRVELPDVR